MTDTYTDQLSDYLDGALDPAERRVLEDHLVECDACRTTLTELRAVVASASALEPLEPARDLWPMIAARIERERDVPLRLADQARHRAMRRLSFTIPQLAAAAVVLVLASAGAVWMLMAGDTATPMVAGSTSGSAVPVSAQNATPGDAGLAQLEAALAGGQTQLDPGTVAVLRRNLLIIEQALVEAQAALAADPANPYLSRHYENTLTKKRELLLQAGSIARGTT